MGKATPTRHTLLRTTALMTGIASSPFVRSVRAVPNTINIWHRKIPPHGRRLPKKSGGESLRTTTSSRCFATPQSMRAGPASKQRNGRTCSRPSPPLSLGRYRAQGL